jgi:hypothetical protein
MPMLRTMPGLAPITKDLGLKTKLYLDDSRECPIGWVCVKNYDEFVSYIKLNGVPDVISFDHDLAMEHYPFYDTASKNCIDYDKYKEKTGYDCAKYLVENDLPIKFWAVHSMNPIGSQNIAGLLLNYERHLSGEPRKSE